MSKAVLETSTMFSYCNLIQFFLLILLAASFKFLVDVHHELLSLIGTFARRCCMFGSVCMDEGKQEM